MKNNLTNDDKEGLREERSVFLGPTEGFFPPEQTCVAYLASVIQVGLPPFATLKCAFGPYFS